MRRTGLSGQLEFGGVMEDQYGRWALDLIELGLFWLDFFIVRILI